MLFLLPVPCHDAKVPIFTAAQALIMMLRALYFVILLLGVITPAHANCTDSNAQEACIDTGQWQINLAMGAGFRSNPLHGGHNFPLWLMPDISYYGQHWFFDNATLGYSWQLRPDIQLSLVSRLNEEQGFFRRQSPVNLFETEFIFDMGIAGPVQKVGVKQELSISQADKRPLALDGGLQLNWFLPDLQLKLNWWHDISQQYDGQHLRIAASTGWQSSMGHWQLGVALAWKDQHLMNTYYGLNTVEGDGLEYRARASWQPEVSLQWQYPLSERWQLLSLWRHRWLNTDVTAPVGPGRFQSPLLQESTVQSWFIGFSYRFL
jgi:outer membrane protein